MSDFFLSLLSILLISLIQGFSGIFYAIMKVGYKYIGDLFGNPDTFKDSYTLIFHIAECFLYILTPIFLLSYSPFTLIVICTVITSICEVVIAKVGVINKDPIVVYITTFFQGGAFTLIKTMMKLCVKDICLQSPKGTSKKLNYYMSFVFAVPSLVFLIAMYKIEKYLENKPKPRGFLDLYLNFYLFVFIGLISSVLAHIINYIRKMNDKNPKEKKNKENKTTKFEDLKRATRDCYKLIYLVIAYSILEPSYELFISRRKEVLEYLMPDFNNIIIVLLLDRILVIFAPIFSWFILTDTIRLQIGFLASSLLFFSGIFISVVQLSLDIKNNVLAIFIQFLLASSSFLMKVSFSSLFIQLTNKRRASVAFGITMSIRTIAFWLLWIPQREIFRVIKSSKYKYIGSYVVFLVFSLIPPFLLWDNNIFSKKNQTNE